MRSSEYEESRQSYKNSFSGIVRDAFLLLLLNRDLVPIMILTVILLFCELLPSPSPSSSPELSALDPHPVPLLTGSKPRSSQLACPSAKLQPWRDALHGTDLGRGGANWGARHMCESPNESVTLRGMQSRLPSVQRLHNLFGWQVLL